jgi:hypothetical protein
MTKIKEEERGPLDPNRESDGKVDRRKESKKERKRLENKT